MTLSEFDIKRCEKLVAEFVEQLKSSYERIRLLRVQLNDTNLLVLIA